MFADDLAVLRNLTLLLVVPKAVFWKYRNYKRIVFRDADEFAAALRVSNVA